MAMHLLHNTSLKTLAAQPFEQVLSDLQTNADQGLSATGAANRIKQYGLNIITTQKKLPGGKPYYCISKVH